MNCRILILVLSVVTWTCSRAAEVAAPKFRAVELDKQVKIGYGVAVADVNGDKRPDIVLADKDLIVWYENPGW